MQSLKLGLVGRPSWSAVIIGLLAGLCGSWAALDVVGFNLTRRIAQRISPPEAGTPQLPETQVSQLPVAPNNGYWDGIAGLNVVRDPAGPDAAMHLTAIGLKQHAMSYHVNALPPDTIFRSSVEVKLSAANDVGIMMEARDSVTSSGQASHYAMVLFDFRLADVVAPRVLATRGDLVADGVETEPDGWIKIWIDQKTADGAAFVQLQMFNLQHELEFRSTGQQISFRRLSIETVTPGDKQ